MMGTPTCGQVNRVILFVVVVVVVTVAVIVVVLFGMKFTETIVRYESMGVRRLIPRRVRGIFK